MIIDKIVFKLRSLYKSITLTISKTKWKLFGMKIGSGTRFSSIEVIWPHQVSIGDNCILEANVQLKFDGVWKKGPSIVIENDCFIGTGVEFNIKGYISVGSNTLIGSGSRFIDHDHGVELNNLIRNQECPTSAIKIEEDVWIGANVVILKGVHINKGAVIAAGAIVNKTVPEYEIWGGVPAKRIGTRI